MLRQLVGGPRDGDWVHCCTEEKCDCQRFGHGALGGNKIADGYVEYLIYKRDGEHLVPSHIERKTMVGGNNCPRCTRPMPRGTIYCKNCGTEMDPLGVELNDPKNLES
jgi:hypothetical protein